MSATPIPRTLQMSLAGVRDISVIETPPEGRRPIKTYVGEYDEELVKGALEREHERGGQAFFLHNRIESIDETAERLRALCPGMRFEVAHGQMDEQELERRMLAFLRGDADVLVSHQHHRVGDRHPAGEHADRRARRHVRPRAAVPDPRPGRALPRARLRLSAVSVRRRADSGGGAAAVRTVATTPSSAPASRSRCATSRSAAPATCSATSSPGTSRRSGSSSTCRCSTRRSARRRGRRRGRGRVGAGAPRRQRRRVRARGLHPVRAGQGRRPPPDRRRARGRRPDASCATSSRTASASCPSRSRT